MTSEQPSGNSQTITSYKATVGDRVSTISVTPTVASTTATIIVNGNKVLSEAASTAISLNIGINTITTVVTALDDTSNSYILIVTRAPSTNAYLSNLALSIGAIEPPVSPIFAPGTTNYTALLSNSQTTIIVTPTAANALATAKVNNILVLGGTASSSIALNVGPNTITTFITAQEGVTTKTYSIIVTREYPVSSNANLSNLVLSAGSLTPSFSQATTRYTATAAITVSSIVITSTAADALVTVKVNSDPEQPGDSQSFVGLNEGDNTITAIVTARDGTTKTYTVIVTRIVSTDYYIKEDANGHFPLHNHSLWSRKWQQPI